MTTKAESLLERNGVLTGRNFHLLWVPVAVFVVCELISALLWRPFSAGELVGVAVPEVAADPEAAAAVAVAAQALLKTAEAASRIDLFAIWIVFELACAGIVVAVLVDIRKTLGPLGRNRFFQAAVLGGSAGAIILFLIAIEALKPAGVFTGVALVDDNLAQLVVADDSNWSLSVLRAALGVVNISTAITVAFLVAAMLSCLSLQPGKSLPDADVWRLHASRFKFFLYMSAALLAVGVVFFERWNGYGGIFITDEAALASYKTIISAATLFIGAEYSLVLGSIALPIASTLSSTADSLARSLATKEAEGEEPKAPTAPENPEFFKRVETVKSEQKLEFSFGETVQTWSALVTPLAASTLVTALASFS